MPKKGGKKIRRGAGKDFGVTRELLIKEEGQEYSQITKILGSGRFQCKCFDGQTRLGLVRGKMNKKIWIELGNFVLVGLREYQDEKCDIFHKYSNDEALRLKTLGELPSDIVCNEKTNIDEDDCAFEFDLI